MGSVLDLLLKRRGLGAAEPGSSSPSASASASPSASASSSPSASAPPPFDPTDIASLDLWLNADEEITLDTNNVTDWRACAGTHIGMQHLQATEAKQPLFSATGINGKAAVDFDGTDDLLVASTAYLTGTSGEVWIVARLDGIPNAYQYAISSANSAVLNQYLGFALRRTGASPNLHCVQRNADTVDDLRGTATTTTDTNYCARFASDGSTITAELNGAADALSAISGSNSGDWWSDTAGRTNVAIGAIKRTTETEFLHGKIRHIFVFNAPLSTEDRDALEAWIADDTGITFS